MYFKFHMLNTSNCALGEDLLGDGVPFLLKSCSWNPTNCISMACWCWERGESYPLGWCFAVGSRFALSLHLVFDGLYWKQSLHSSLQSHFFLQKICGYNGKWIWTDLKKISAKPGKKKRGSIRLILFEAVKKSAKYFQYLPTTMLCCRFCTSWN